MNNKALVVIDIQNDITKHYRDIIGVHHMCKNFIVGINENERFAMHSVMEFPQALQKAYELGLNL